MKTALDLVNDCDQLPHSAEATSDFYSLKLDGSSATFGFMVEEIVQAFTWNEHWTVEHDTKTVILHGATLEERNERLRSTLLAEKDKNTFKMLQKWTGEVFSIYGPDQEVALSIERNAAPLFGVLTYGVQMIAYQKVNNLYRLWIAQRSEKKLTFPNMLDSTVGGSLQTGELPRACLLREAWEEARFPKALTDDLVKPCGILSYVYVSDERSGGETGLIQPEIQYLYEMQVPLDVEPCPGDDEAKNFRLMTIDKVKKALEDGEFTPTNGCVVIEFLIRHGFLTPENEVNYLEILSRLRRQHTFPTASFKVNKKE